MTTPVQPATAPEPTVLTVTRGGHVFHVLDSPQTRSWNFWDLFRAQWEPTTLAAIDAHLPVGGLLWDIGAWVGPVSLWAAVARGARVWALEPDPVAYLQLIENIRRNGLAPQIRALQTALAAQDGVLTLYATGGDTRSSLTQPQGAGTPLAVPTISPATLLKDSGRPDLIKMDIEGGGIAATPRVGPLAARPGHPPGALAAPAVVCARDRRPHAGGAGPLAL